MNNAVAAALLAATLQAQGVDLRIYSEFQRVDPFGEVVAVDRSQTPREILSPALARNAYASFHVVLTAPVKSNSFLAVQANPAGVLRWTLYEERFARHRGAWIPDALAAERPPYFGVLPDPRMPIAGQTARVFLLDVWVPPEAPAGRVRLEAVAKVGGERVAPLEIRIFKARVPRLRPRRSTPGLPAADQPADAAAWNALEAYLAGERLPGFGPPSNIRAVIRRNAVQDMALARELEKRVTRAAILDQIRQAVALSDRSQASPDRRSGAEWYLKIRDYLYREASR